MATAATYRILRWSNAIVPSSYATLPRACIQCRGFQSASRSKPPNYAFALDIDGVLLRASKPLPGARDALHLLQRRRIPFIFLTNGGGKSEKERVDQLSGLLDVPLDTSMFVQSHTPFEELVHKRNGQEGLRDKCVLVVGGEGDKCRQVAQSYGFTNVVIPADLLVAFPDLWPFASTEQYASIARPLRTKTLASETAKDAAEPGTLKIDAILVFNDPRDWALDTQVILDLLLSRGGYFGTMSSKNGDASLSNKGFQQDGQPPIYFSNPDLLWAAAWHLPRLGQGAFREALEGIWTTITGGQKAGVVLQKEMLGKPFQGTYEFAEQRLMAHREDLLRSQGSDSNDAGKLNHVYMIGDNPESDIIGANSYQSPLGTTWQSILVRSGVYRAGEEPAHRPAGMVEGIWEAVQWGIQHGEGTT